jgi:branched-chain amino acid transport system permease protein
MLTSLLQALVSGLSLGAVYALCASGLGIVFGLFGVINFAHTQGMMLGAVTAFIATNAGVPYLPALLIGVVATALFGLVTERVFIRPLLGSQTAQVDTLFVTLGLSIVLENGTLLLWGSETRYFDSPFDGVVEVGDISLSTDRVVTIVTALFVFAALSFLVNHTRRGKAIVATSQNPDAALVIGIPVQQTRALAFAVGSGLAGLGGILWATTYSASYLTGSTFLILSFVLVVMSGPGNIGGILVCSLLLGVTESLAGTFFDAKWQRLAVMVLFILVILMRPQGLGSGRLARRTV